MYLSSLYINNYILIILIGAALYFDITRNIIPNYLTFTAIIWGLSSYLLIQGLNGLWFSSLGLLVGLAIFFIPFAMGGMGAGDVKFLGAIGALQGWPFVVTATLLAALAGGIMSLFYLIKTRRLLKVLKKMVGFILAPIFSFLYYRIRLKLFHQASVYFDKCVLEAKETSRLPYGVAIATGALAFYVLNYFPWGNEFLDSLPWH